MSRGAQFIESQIGNVLSIAKWTIADVCLVIYAVASIAFDDGSLASQIARVLIVVGAFTEINKKKMRLTDYHVWLIVFAALVFASRFWATSESNAIGIFSTVVFNVVCLSCAAFLVYQDKRRIRLVALSLALAPLILEIRVIYQGGVFAFLNDRSIEGISANTVGVFSVVGAFLAFVFYREGANKWFLVMAVLDLATALLSASRKAVVVFFLCALFLVLFSSSKNGHFGKIAKVAGVVALFALCTLVVMNVPLLYDLVGSRLEGVISGFMGDSLNTDSSTQTRMRLIEYGVGWFEANPILGYGGDNFRHLMAVLYPRGDALYAHNNYVELLVDYGLVGAVLYYWFYVRLAVKYFKRPHRYDFFAVTLFSLLLGLVIIEYGLVDYYSRDAQMIILLIWAGVEYRGALSATEVDDDERSD